ncbi:peptidase inhibitor family I36 protein [Amycolatopsis ultiminotia]|uniref:Peptidase inhibitor family I36 protein n=1 Tax=Amycolatopsis ultiminotia TaxID=543629 RepID=A0ABP6WIK9_9PSEU
MRKVLAAAVAVVAMCFIAPSASGADAPTGKARNGKCEAGEFCLYWGAAQRGAVSDFRGSVSSYGSSQPGCYEFKTPKAPGHGQCVKNNAVSARNLTHKTVRVYFNSNYRGAYDTIKPGQSVPLHKTFVNNASHKLL